MHVPSEGSNSLALKGYAKMGEVFCKVHSCVDISAGIVWMLLVSLMQNNALL